MASRKSLQPLCNVLLSQLPFAQSSDDSDQILFHQKISLGYSRAPVYCRASSPVIRAPKIQIVF
jgi:hypothetical protein